MVIGDGVTVSVYRVGFTETVIDLCGLNACNRVPGGTLSATNSNTYYFRGLWLWGGLI